MMVMIYLSDGTVALLRVVALHGRKPGTLQPYARPSSWLATVGYEHAWRSTRRDAIAELLKKLGGSLEPPLPDNVVRLGRTK